jgi:hypothetical protein
MIAQTNVEQSALIRHGAVRSFEILILVFSFSF